MARPTKYSEAILDKANDYLENHILHGDIIHMLCGLSLHLDICRDTIYAWQNDGDKPEFSYIVSKIMQAQEKKLMNGGITGDFNASITKLALTKHGYTDKQSLEGVDGQHLIPDSLSISFVKPK